MADGKRRREKGEFTARRVQLQRRQRRYARVYAASRLALTMDDVWLYLDGFRLLLTHDPYLALHNGYHHLEIVRTKSYGLRIADVCEKGRGYVRLVGISTTIGLRDDQTLVFVRAIEQDGERLEWLP